MKRLLLVIFLVIIAWPINAAAAPLPVTTLDTALEVMVDSRPVGVCEGYTVFGSTLRIGTALYTLYTTATKFVLLDAADGDATPVWRGRIKHDGKFDVVEELNYAAYEQRGTGCIIFSGLAIDGGI